jgi:hypothetical protein
MHWSSRTSNSSGGDGSAGGVVGAGCAVVLGFYFGELGGEGAVDGLVGVGA